ncbi:TetR/AcrR family transcriptional regulator [Oerskovia sp. KBS0722]|uniref:TetR/AcrR family transcriptional regulator n=1 Tax=Oerskovia sp. KBS0722 TaxID=1179673 RepID=UPI00110D2633|nr:TetR/AcrR family transcriptional regulator [Oerskovia sp. KBS0722]QDW63160.1 TetR/AcrR family transcriptional regulator [Oerskovia sp. KBS0722]
MARDGVYAKGRLKREEILDVALEVFADEGYRGTSLRTIAARCGLTVAGVMHYFDSREDLLTQVIFRRDQTGRPIHHDAPRTLAENLRGNAERPGLVELFVSLTAAARDREHPAHEVLAQRYAGLRVTLREDVVARQEAGELPARLDPDALARLILATADGAQLQWMVDDEATLAGPLDTLLYDVLGLARP